MHAQAMPCPTPLDVTSGCGARPLGALLGRFYRTSRCCAGLVLKLILVSSLSAYPVVMPAEQEGDGKGWMGL